MASSLSLLVIDDHRIFAEALCLALGLEPDVRSVAKAHTGRDGLAMAAALDITAAVVDLDLPDLDGIEVVTRLGVLRPAARIVVLTAHARPDLAQRAVAAGAAAFLPKEAPLVRITAALRGQGGDEPVVDLGAARPASVGHVGLTPRELDVLRQLAQGRDAQQTAATLGISLYTARDHIKALMAKLGARSQLEAVVSATSLGLVTVGSRY
ncbi:DNA-binding response regulator, NarL/FixJ family, contains REC and HTH domains [Parafrankia irregularis]|uniref:DNA-binding response regulator, NarL/FixJ family, contains REC and HTH domains n=1 Tax=Parafrankia irregularis TaxID=795642 RepID=A0A0S4QUW4_9ACTN|nr:MULTISPECIES: response regulator transcription factor [Parafrankia]MBE3201517.1 response regulator transcription factor [Parafrankia sp. CH37]CUU59413.1 DNA-binding response regulator, NarL/FixJ family, contains REC and HTH domains [Parafrankia irregularis]